MRDFLTSRVIGTIILWMILRAQSPWLNLGYRLGKLKTIKELYKPAVAFMAFPIGLALSIQGIVLAIGIFIGPPAVVIFSAYRTLTRVLVQIITLLNQAIWPEISLAYGLGDIELIKQLHRKFSSIAFWTGLICIALIAVSSDFIIKIWTRNVFASNNLLLGLLLIAGFLNILWQTSWVALMATNNHQNISLAFIASSIFSLAISIQLLPYFGISGAAIAIIIAEIPMIYFVINGGIKISKDNWKIYIISIVKNPLRE